MSAAALTSAAAARSAARAILAQRQFRQPSVPRPLHGVLHALGRVLQAPERWIVRGVDRLARVIPGGAAVVWTVLALILLAIGVIAARIASRRVLDGGLRATGSRAGGAPRGAAELERDADRAEREGRLAEAVRLQFAAGLARLAEQGAIAAPASTPTGELARALQSPQFDALARRFDEIAYGSDTAEPADVQDARRRWPEIVRAGRKP